MMDEARQGQLSGSNHTSHSARAHAHAHARPEPRFPRDQAGWARRMWMQGLNCGLDTHEHTKET